MDKTIIKNHWILASLLLIITLILGLAIVAIIRYFNIPTPASVIAGVIGAIIVGYIYAANFKEVMPKKLRIKVTVIYIITQIILGALYVFWIRGELNWLLFSGILAGVSLFYSLFIYWTLGSGGRMYLKYSEGLQKHG